MKIAIPYWRGRVSPVFDVAVNLYLIEIQDKREILRSSIVLSANGTFARARELSDLGVDVLICGAVSYMQEMTLRNAKIKLFTFICGDVEDVIAAVIQGTLATGAFQMPGCCGRRRKNGHGGGKMPGGDGSGPLQNGSGKRRGTGGSLFAGPGGKCVCIHCGNCLPHIQGQPCNQRQCPKCGNPMTRR